MTAELKNKIYLISREDCDYDEFDAFVIIAENREEAINLCRFNHDKVEYIGRTARDAGIVLGSFNAG